jgi:hypothetical protein
LDEPINASLSVPGLWRLAFRRPPHLLGLIPERLSADGLRLRPALVEPAGPSNGLAAVPGAPAHLPLARALLQRAMLPVIRVAPGSFLACARTAGAVERSSRIVRFAVSNRLPSHNLDALPKNARRRAAEYSPR